MNIEMTKKEKLFLNAYLQAIDFTECGEMNQPQAGSDLDEDFLRESVIDCLAFYSLIQCFLSDDNIEQAGHDFWLTRNGHGAGFWDRPEIYGKLNSESFTKYSENFGVVNAYFEEETGSDLDEARCGDCHSYGERGTTCNNCKRGIYSEEIE